MVWRDVGLDPGVLDHWRTLYPLGQWASLSLSIYICIYIYIYIYIYKQDLALNNPQRLICHKTQPTKQQTTKISKSCHYMALAKKRRIFWISAFYVILISNSNTAGFITWYQPSWLRTDNWLFFDTISTMLQNIRKRSEMVESAMICHHNQFSKYIPFRKCI